MNDKLLRQVIGGVVLLLVLMIVIRWFNKEELPEGQTSPASTPAASAETRVYEVEPPAQPPSGAQPKSTSPEKREIALAAPDDATASAPALPEAGHERSAAASAAAVNTNVPPQPADSRGKYVVQVGSYTNQSYADALVKELSTAGYPVLIEEASMEGRKIFRVRIGPYSEETARVMSAQLNEKLKQPAAVMRR